MIEMKITKLEMGYAHNIRLTISVDSALKMDVVGYIISSILHPSHLEFWANTDQIIYKVELTGSASPMDIFNVCEMIMSLECGIHKYDDYSFGDYEFVLKGFMDD